MAKTRRYKKLKKRTKDLASRVDQLAKVVKQNRPELKYSDYFTIAQYFNYSPTVSYVSNPFANISQDLLDVNARVGDKIFVKNVHIHGQLHNLDNVPFIGRIVAVLVKNNSEGLLTTANFGNLFQESAYTNTVNMVHAPFDWDNRGNFKVIYDKRFVMNPLTTHGSTGAAIESARNFDIKLKINKEVAFFQGGTAQTKNALFLLFLGHRAATSNQWFEYVQRTTFVDP